MAPENATSGWEGITRPGIEFPIDCSMLNQRVVTDFIRGVFKDMI
jgi:hypothetical protein